MGWIWEYFLILLRGESQNSGAPLPRLFSGSRVISWDCLEKQNLNTSVIIAVLSTRTFIHAFIHAFIYYSKTFSAFELALCHLDRQQQHLMWSWTVLFRLCLLLSGNRVEHHTEQTAAAASSGYAVCRWDSGGRAVWGSRLKGELSKMMMMGSGKLLVTLIQQKIIHNSDSK